MSNEMRPPRFEDAYERMIPELREFLGKHSGT